MSKEQRRSIRVEAGTPCELVFPELLAPIAAVIVNVSTSGMRLRVPRILEKHLQGSFSIRWKIDGVNLEVALGRVYSPAAGEIAVRFLGVDAFLKGKITRHVYSCLKERALERELAGASKVASIEDAKRRMLNKHAGLGSLRPDPAVRKKNKRKKLEEYHHSRLYHWMDQRIGN